MSNSSSTKYFEAVGRRKTSVARVRIWPAAKNSFVLNDKDIKDYFVTEEQKNKITSVFAKSETKEKFKVSVKVSGGGISSQADAVVLGLSRAMIKLDEGLRKTLKKEGFLKRDPRIKERRKFGLKKARKAPQWSKR